MLEKKRYFVLWEFRYLFVFFFCGFIFDIERERMLEFIEIVIFRFFLKVFWRVSSSCYIFFFGGFLGEFEVFDEGYKGCLFLFVV